MYLEDQRGLHEDLERLEDAIAARYLAPRKNLKDQRATDHEIADFLDRISKQSARLKALYDDPAGEKQKEVQKIGTGDTYAAFYEQLGEIKQYHGRYPGAPVENLEKAYERKAGTNDGTSMFERVGRMFNGEEVLGKYFDLVEHHSKYLNLRGVQGTRRLTYLQYVDFFDSFQQYPIKRLEKLSDEYFAYVNALAEYLEGFWKRTRPLEDWEGISTQWDKEFEEEWKNDKIPGWAKAEQPTGDDTPMTDVPGSDATGWFCNECEKDFSNENVWKGHLNGKKHKQAVKRKEETNTNGVKARASVRDKERTIAHRETFVKRLAASMQSERQDTKTNVERRAGMTERERQQEIEQQLAAEEGFAAADDDNGEGGNVSDDDDKIHNPLKLPLSWDGKPIPFWLYKLHGLGVEYPCEICGGYVYAGRRAFEKHFTEPRHTYGLRCLGVNNSSLYREITSIEDVRKLQTQQEKIKKEEKAQVKGNVEEMEDDQGNVMPKTVYEDLRKQGLI